MQDLMLKFCGSDDSAFADLGERIDLIKNLDELTLAQRASIEEIEDELHAASAKMLKKVIKIKKDRCT